MAARKRKSRKQSVGKAASSQRHELELVIFLDENHCNNKAILEALATAGVAVERHCNHFPSGTEDVVWLPEVGRRRWIAVTTDDHIRRRAVEKREVLRHNVRLFVFTSNNLAGATMAAILIKALPEMRKLIRKQTAPFIPSITKSSAINLLWPPRA